MPPAKQQKQTHRTRDIVYGCASCHKPIQKEKELLTTTCGACGCKVARKAAEPVDAAVVEEHAYSSTRTFSTD